MASHVKFLMSKKAIIGSVMNAAKNAKFNIELLVSGWSMVSVVATS